VAQKGGDKGERLSLHSRAYLDHGDGGLRRELAALELDPEAGSFVLFNALKGAFLHLGELYRGADLSAWQHPHCPVCGGAPALGVMEGEGGKRHLLCHRCETRWPWRRITCAFCGNDDPHLLRYLTLEEEGDAPKMRIDACDSCQAYLKVRDQRTAPADFPEIEDLLTPRVDLAASRQGFHRGAPNVFGVRMGGADVGGTG
jgi:formate dehydrogenase accessory protein FdhE